MHHPPTVQFFSYQRYEPPPFGPGTSLNRPSYGVTEMKPQCVQALSRRPQGMVIAGACVTFAAIAYIPISELKIEYECIIINCMVGGCNCN